MLIHCSDWATEPWNCSLGIYLLGQKQCETAAVLLPSTAHILQIEQPPCKKMH